MQWRPSPLSLHRFNGDNLDQVLAEQCLEHEDLDHFLRSHLCSKFGMRYFTTRFLWTIKRNTEEGNTEDVTVVLPKGRSFKDLESEGPVEVLLLRATATTC